MCQWDLTDNSLLCHGAYQVPGFWGLARSISLNLPNNKVKVVSHRSYGFRRTENYIDAIWHDCANLPQE